MNIKNIVYNRISILASATLFAVAMVYFFAVNFYIEYKVVIRDTRLKEEEITKKEGLIEEIKNYNEINKDLLAEELEKINSLPLTSNSADVYIGIIQNNHSVKITDYSFGSGVQNRLGDKKEKSGVHSISASFNASGQFSSFLDYLKYLERTLPLIEIESIDVNKISYNGEDDEEKSYNLDPYLSFEVKYKYYYH